MEGQIFLGIFFFVLRRQHRIGTSVFRRVYPLVPAECLQVSSHRLLNGLHIRGSNKVILSYTDWYKDWKAMGIFSADLRADFVERRCLQLHKHLPVFTLSLSPLSQSQWDFEKSLTLPRMLPFVVFFFISETLKNYPLFCTTGYPHCLHFCWPIIAENTFQCFGKQLSWLTAAMCQKDFLSVWTKLTKSTFPFSPT